MQREVATLTPEMLDFAATVNDDGIGHKSAKQQLKDASRPVSGKTNIRSGNFFRKASKALVPEEAIKLGSSINKRVPNEFNFLKTGLPLSA